MGDCLEDFAADEDAAVAMGLSNSLELPPSPSPSPSALSPEAPVDTPARPKRKAQTVLAPTPEKKVRIVKGNLEQDLVQDKMSTKDIPETLHRPAEVGEVL